MPPLHSSSTVQGTDELQSTDHFSNPLCNCINNQHLWPNLKIATLVEVWATVTIVVYLKTRYYPWPIAIVACLAQTVVYILRLLWRTGQIRRTICKVDDRPPTHFNVALMNWHNWNPIVGHFKQLHCGAVFLYEFKLNMLDFMFRFMLSNICYHNKNQSSFQKLKFLFRFMFRSRRL